MNFSDISEITINNKTVSEIDCYGALIYPFTDLEINCIWNDANNWDDVRPLSVNIRTYASYKGHTGLYKTFVLNESNNWKASENIPAYTFSVSVDDVNPYTHSISQDGNKFDITYTHPVQTIDIPITVTTNSVTMDAFNVSLKVDDVIYDTKTFYVDNPVQQYFYDVPLYSRGGGSYANSVPVPQQYPNYRTTVTGNTTNGFLIKFEEPTGIMDLKVLIDVSSSSYPSDMENIAIDISTTNGDYIKTLHYSDFTVGTYQGNTLLEYDSDIVIGDYYVRCTNAESLIRDCELSSISFVDAYYMIDEDSTSSGLLYLVYE